MSTNHTAGRWSLEGDRIRLRGTNDSRAGDTILKPGSIALLEQDANLRLAAAAPLLFEACKVALSHFDEHYPEMDFGVPAQLRAALEAAEGKG